MAFETNVQIAPDLKDMFVWEKINEIILKYSYFDVDGGIRRFFCCFFYLVIFLFFAHVANFIYEKDLQTAFELNLVTHSLY